MANPVKTVGKGVVFLGVGAVFIMSIVGALSLDLLLLYMVSRDSRHNNSLANLIVTFWLWDRLISKSEHFYQDIGLMILASPFITAITVGLSFAVGLPEFGLVLIGGWVASFSIILAGAVIHGIGEMLEAAIGGFVGGMAIAVDQVDELAAPKDQDSQLRHSHQHVSRGAAKPPAYTQSANDAGWAGQVHYSSPLAAPTNAASAPPPPRYDELEDEGTFNPKSRPL